MFAQLLDVLTNDKNNDMYFFLLAFSSDIILSIYYSFSIFYMRLYDSKIVLIKLNAYMWRIFAKRTVLYIMRHRVRARARACVCVYETQK